MPTKQSTQADGHSPALPQLLSDLAQEDLHVKLHLLQHYAKLAEMLAREIMEEEVQTLAGARYQRDKPHEGRYSRWGVNPGSIQIGDERVPVAVPRVRDTGSGEGAAAPELPADEASRGAEQPVGRGHPAGPLTA